MEFPHYTWGYIGMPAFSSALPCVPSLYVRIYRSEPIRCRAFSGSLTIREGISSWKIMNVNLITFPHYTWGYIAYTTASWRTKRVPSLYVRVYRKISLSAQKSRCSLTIREGISRWFIWFLISWPFPHYTWGYIDITNGRRTTTPVPSLYVRVYRTENEVLLLWDGSFTIREGIS